MSQIQLYSYYRSSASYRVRIALLLKNLEYEYIPVHLVKDGGEQNADDFHKKNPMGEVPVLVHNNQSLSQSMAIIQYLDTIAHQPLLFQKDDFKSAKLVELCE
mgnify:CR=1 FL=1